MLMRRTFLATVIALIALTACSLPTVNKEADAKARALYRQISAGADLSQNPDLAPNLRTPEALAQMTALKALLPSGAPTAAVTRGWSINTGTGGTNAVLTHAYSYPAGTVLARTTLVKGKGGVWSIVGVHLTAEAASGAPGGGRQAAPVKPSEIT